MTLLPAGKNIGQIVQHNATVLLKDGTHGKGDIYQTFDYGTKRFHTYVNGWAGRVYVREGESVEWVEK